MKNVPKGHSLHSAFTMIELIFVIVILGILSAIAIPKFASTKNMADIGAARADVAAIRSSIMSERQSRLILGDSDFISKLSTTTTKLFDGNGTGVLLRYGIVAGSSNTVAGKWTSADSGAGLLYDYRADSVSVRFTYAPTEGTFTCDRTVTECKKIVD